MAKNAESFTVGTYLLQRLVELGVGHIFGVPGDFSLKFCKLIEDDKRISFIGTSREDTAGFAADGYARRMERGLGVVLVTHGVGALSTVNPIAGANAESSPVVVISGTPGLNERAEKPLIHHCFGPYDAQKKIFENFTCRAESLDDLSSAVRQIDHVLEDVWSKKRPGYLELPRDMIDKKVSLRKDYESFCEYESSDEETLAEALEETVALLHRAKSPVILAGVELHRHGVQAELVDLVESANMPVAATIMGKSVISESHPCYLGVYQGAVGSEVARKIVEEADMVITLGVLFTDINLGMYTARLDPNHMVRANQGEVVIKHHKYSRIMLRDFLKGLAGRLNSVSSKPVSGLGIQEDRTSAPNSANRSSEKLTMAGVISLLNGKITPDMAIVSDTGDCLFAATELTVPDHTAFFASAFYTTMGFAVPAALGVNCAAPESRPLILVGDGAFQMTGTELSTFGKLDLAPIVLIINNGGYETERVILDGRFNDIPEWHYEEVTRMIGHGRGYRVETTGELESALDEAVANRKEMAVINAIVTDSSRGMRRLAEEISHRI